MSTVARVEELRLQRAQTFDKMKKVNETALEEKRDLSAEEKQEFDRLEDELRSLTEQVERNEKLAGIEQSGGIDRRAANGGGSEADVDPEKREAPKTLKEFQEQRAADDPTRVQDTPEYRKAFFRLLTVRDIRQLEPEEQRVLSKASAGAGLNTVPTLFRNTLIDTLREYGVMRQISTVFTTDSGDAIQVPTVTSHGTGAWIAENGAFSPSDDAFGQATLNAYKYGTEMRVSWELLEDSAFDLEAYIRREFGLRIGIGQNTAYISGDGSGKPTGVATQASAGVTAAGAAAITTDELIDLYHSLLAPYRARASWLFKDSTVKLIRKLKDSTNQYLWQPGLTAGAPDTLLGRPVYIDPDMAAATTGLVSVLFGDFSYYNIRDVNSIQFQRLNELFAENGQVGFLAWMRSDGKLLNTAAVKKLTQA